MTAVALRRPVPTNPDTRFGAAEADKLDDIELDNLPFGVVCLASDGLILRYNLAEARLARLDPATVVGRNFFTDVAPCTNTEEFYGRFRRVVERKTDDASFRYVFDFKFGAQDVDVEVLRIPDGDRFYLFINRRKMLPPREGPEAREPAPLQSDLSGNDEEQLGILRNDRSERVVASPVLLFEALARRVERESVELWRDLSHDWGLDTGRRLVIELETEAPADGDQRQLREQPMRDVVERISNTLRDQGWGLATFDFTHAERGVLHIELQASALASLRTKSGRACHFLADGQWRVGLGPQYTHVFIYTHMCTHSKEK